MNIDGGRKPFPFLRRGDGLTRYSSVKYPNRPKPRISVSNYQSSVSMNALDSENILTTGDDGGKNQEIDELAAAADSGKGSSPNDCVIDEHFRAGLSPKNDALSDSSITDRRLAWEANEKRENLEVNHFEALEKFLAAMNSSLKSDYSALYKPGTSAENTPSRDEGKEPGAGYVSTPEERNNFQIPTTNPLDDRINSPVPFSRQFDNVFQRPTQTNGLNGFPNPNQIPRRFPAPETFFQPRLAPPLMQPPFSFLDNPNRFNPPPVNSGLVDVEKELRALMTSLERDADQLQRRRALLDEHVEMTKKQLCAEWQSVEQERERLKIQRMKVDQDTNDLLTHRMKMEDEVKANLDKCEKAQMELKMLQTECQLLKKKLVEQKKQASDEISSVQQQVIDLQRQAVDSDSRASSFRTQISKLKDECRQYKEEADAAKARNSLLEAANERSRAENAQLRIHCAEQREKAAAAGPSTAAKCLKLSSVNSDQNKGAQSQPSKCVRFADEPAAFRRTKDSCVQAAGPADMATQTSFLETSPSMGICGTGENNAILERTLGGGKKEVIYPNDTVQIRDNDGAETFSYANGDVLRCLPDGTKIYHSASDGRTEIRNSDGTLVVKNADGTSEKYTFMPDGTEIVTYSNGTMIEKRSYGVEIAHLYDKSKETRCSHYTLREFPSGDIKKLFADGSTETRLVCGRVRVKDPKGNVIKDMDEYPMRPAA